MRSVETFTSSEGSSIFTSGVSSEIEGDFTFRSGSRLSFPADGEEGCCASCAGGDAGADGACDAVAGDGDTGDDGACDAVAGDGDTGDADAGDATGDVGDASTALDGGVDTFSTMFVIEFKSPAFTSRGCMISRISTRTNMISMFRSLIIPFAPANLFASM
ncbi:hypothetical protein ACT8ZS_07790 [Paenibacillus sp. M.A.Huq-84]